MNMYRDKDYHKKYYIKNKERIKKRVLDHYHANKHKGKTDSQKLAEQKYYRLFKEKYGYTYNALHMWIRRNKTKMGVCSICNEYKETTWANISGEYKRELDDYTELCDECHLLYDSKR